MVEDLIAVDIGNTTIDIGEFVLGETTNQALPQLQRHRKVIAADLTDEIELDPRATCRWHIGSVNETALQGLVSLVDRLPGEHAVHVIDYTHLPLSTAVSDPSSVGIDRLAAACAANRLRHPNHPALVVDAGTAITVDLISAKGVFLGGMIAPGMALSLRNLAKETDRLPHIPVGQRAPSMIGEDTAAAIESGVFWMTLAGIDQCVRRLRTEIGEPCEVFATGGSMPAMLPYFEQEIRFEPYLVLAGLAVARP